ncbi:type II CRISPR RNA-guided endonuclease Cas9 [Phenylobacterium sp.]|uniref:type II CRISPR RNA-guided endonuclease Cas9 n=1 Tax=Phenylobacterium sp. TaxID=1871053 RepID=UPI0039605A14
MRRLGIDIGVASLGWCLIEDGGETSRIVDLGVRIFSPGRDPKTGASLAVDRRNARAMRRRRDRYLGRRAAFLRALVAFGLMPADPQAARALASLDPYDLRLRALSERLEPHEIGRALFHLNQRRGFKSNRKADRKSGEDGKIALGAAALDAAMTEAGAETLGQFLAGRESRRVRMGGENQAYDFYPQRRHVEHEFETIWRRQAVHHPEIMTEEARAALARVLFFQRPLKAPEVGVCAFVASERRIPKAHPLFQRLRLYQEVNHLRIVAPGEAARPLTLDERNALVMALRDRKERSFEQLAKVLKLAAGQRFSVETEARKSLKGDELRAALGSKKAFGAAWALMSDERQWAIVERLMEEEVPERLADFLVGDCGLSPEAAREVAGANLPEGHGRLGETASRRVLAELEKEVVTYDEAVRRCGWNHSDDSTGEVLERLPYYGQILDREIPPGSQDPRDDVEKRFGRITNPTVHVGLRQLEKVVNAVIDRHGRPDQIVVELARELKLNEQERKAHDKRIRETTAAAVARGKLLGELGQADTGANRMLLRLWEELNPTNPLDRRCPYCAKVIGPTALFSGEVDIDHIVPYSRCLDDSAGNKVVAHRACNREKGARTPYERWGGEARWEVIADQVSRLHRSKQWRFSPDAMERFEKDGDFIARQLTDTQYLARITAKYLRRLYPAATDGFVYVIPGRMTAMLRRVWGLNSLLPDHNYVENPHSAAPKNRLDHRHHAIDAAVAAATTRSLLQRIAEASARSEAKDLDRRFAGLDEPPWPGFREALYERLQATVVSHKPDHGRRGRPPPGKDTTSGRLHNDTAYGLTGEFAADGRTPIVVHRVPLASLKPADIAALPDPPLRDALWTATRGLEGKAFEAALAAFAAVEGPFKGIRRVRVREPLNVIPIRDREGRAYKAYKGDANARFDVWRLPDGKWVSDVVSMFDAHRRDLGDRRPHPAAKKVLSLRQNDLLAMDLDGSDRALMRVVKFSSSGQITLASHNEGGSLKARDADKGDPFRYLYSSASGLRKLRARQVRVDPAGRVYDPGPRG